MPTKVAVIQKPPVLLDRDKTIVRALASIDEAAREGATLLVFPEAYIPGYPTWIRRLKPGGDMALSNEINARLRQNAVDLSGNGLRPLQEAAAKHGVTIVMGLHEIDSKFSGTTLFNTVVVIGPDGALLNRHRKLMPTNPERMVWGMGDATGLKVVDTPAGRLGSLICWESYMPLARYALYAQGMEIYVNPTWDSGETWVATLATHCEGSRCMGDRHGHGPSRKRHSGRLSRTRPALQTGGMDQRWRCRRHQADRSNRRRPPRSGKGHFVCGRRRRRGPARTTVTRCLWALCPARHLLVVRKSQAT